MTDVDDTIAAFWRLFEARAPALSDATSADSPVYDELLEQLQKVDPGLWLEICFDPQGRELIVTADGKLSLFPLTFATVEAAPVIDGWQIRALKPKLGFPETTRWEELALRTADLVFDPLELEGSDDLGLRIFVPGLAAAQADDAHNAILRAIDHGLGEQRFAEAVRHTEIRPLPEGVASDDFIPLVDLERFLDWRARRRRGAPVQ
jgi:hypothetical protein